MSAYASTHPWEDWAETFAHYIHMVDALDTAEAEGMEPRAAGLQQGAAWPFRAYDLYRDEGFPELMARWIPLTLALNSMSRSIGNVDFYPFVIPAPAYDKLAFVQRVIREGRNAGRRHRGEGLKPIEFSASAGQLGSAGQVRPLGDCTIVRRPV